MAKIWLFVLLLTMVVGGCQRSPGEAERRLIAIDSLIAAQPDSALALLVQVDTATLAEPDRAYHALLQTQAMYKAGIPVDDSTLICRAQRYYADHGPVDRQIRTMSYRASVAEDLGDPELAMRWYKRTELAARDHHDDNNTAYALMSMGVLYQSNFEFDYANDKYRQALKALPADSIRHLVFCNLQLAQLGLDATDMGADSIIYFADIANNYARKIGDSAAIATASLIKAEKLFYDSNLNEAKSLFASSLASFGEFIPCSQWQIASQIYARLGMADSARYYHEKSPDPQNANDSSHFLHAQALLCALEGNHQESLRYEKLSDEITSNTLLSANGATLVSAERETEYSFKTTSSSPGRKTLITLNIIVLISTALLWYVTLKRKSEKAKKTIDELLEKMKSELAQMKKEYERAGSVQQHDNHVVQGRELVHIYLDRIRKQIKILNNPKFGLLKFKDDIQQDVSITSEEQEFWLSEFCHRLLYPDARQLLEDIAAKCPLSDREKVVLMLVALDFSDVEIQAMVGATNDAYARILLSRITKRAQLDFSIRKEFRRINSSHNSKPTDRVSSLE